MPSSGWIYAGRNMYAALNGRRQQRVLRPPLDPRPHDSPTLAAVRPAARDVDEGHPRIEPGQRPGYGQCQIIGEPRVALLRESRRRDPETEEAGVEARELGLDGAEVGRVGHHQVAQLLVRLPVARRPTASTRATPGSRRHSRSTPLPDHAGGAEKQDVHYSQDIATPDRSPSDPGRPRAPCAAEADRPPLRRQLLLSAGAPPRRRR